MNQLINNQALTMTSVEISELTGKRHSDVMRDIRVIQDQIDESKFAVMSVYVDSSNRMRDMWIMDHDEVMTLLTGYNVNLRMKVVKRWRELEAKQAPAALTQDEQLLALAQGVIKLTAERDEAIKTKALIGSKREATLMNKASQDSKRIKKLETQIQSEGDYLSIIGAKLPERVDTEIMDNKQTWRLLTSMSKTMGYETKKVPCPRYGEVKAYHIDVIAAFKKTYL